jgi:hypothetical protein
VLAEAQIEVIVGLTDAVFDFRLVIRAEEMLLLPFVCFLADMDEPFFCKNMTALGATAVAVLTVQELGLGPEMVLSQRLGIGDE